MFDLKDPYVLQMAFLRIFAGSIEVMAAFLMIYFNRIETSLQINSILALIGPLIMLSVTTVGLVGLAGQVSLTKLVVILFGACCIIFATLKL